MDELLWYVYGGRIRIYNFVEGQSKCQEFSDPKKRNHFSYIHLVQMC